MPVEYYDGSSYSTIRDLQHGDQTIQEVRYYDGSSYQTVFLPVATIDDFEHNDIPRYYDDPSGTGTVDTTSSAAYEGDYGAHFDGQREVWSNPGDGLQNYYELGDWAEFWFYPVDTSDTPQYWFAFGDGDTNEWDNHYEIEAIMGSGTFRVQKREGGSSTTLMDDGTTINWSSQWYRVEWLAESDQVRARLYDESGQRLDNLQADEDPTNGGSWSWPGKFGMRCNSDAGEVYVDEVQQNPMLV